MSMFCRQCEQTAKGTGCTVRGVCGKDESVAVLQDLLLHSLKGLGFWGSLAMTLVPRKKEWDRMLIEGLFATVTNVDFDPDRIVKLVQDSYAAKEEIKKAYLETYIKKNGKGFSTSVPPAAEFAPQDSLDGLIEQGRTVGLLSEPQLPADIRSLRETLLFGMKGMAAYADHAFILGKADEQVNAFFYRGLAALVDQRLSAQDLLALIMEFGRINLTCLELLDAANTEAFASPEPTQVSLGVKMGPAIVVSGHDLLDLKMLLEQTEDSGVKVYTHGEMLPAHAYPGLKKYKHLAGHFGTAWQNQQKEFDDVPAVFLFTTNCIQEPKPVYRDRVFTTGLVAWPGVTHISADRSGRKDFQPLIQKALKLGGFPADAIEKAITVGFAHTAVLSRASGIIEAVKAKKIRHFFLIGGCDGAKPGRNYYTEFAQKVPKDCLILTLACGKFRFNRLDFGTIAEFPRLLDCGQCNDAYSAVRIALALAEAFKCSINELPLTLVLSWYEQKAVCILLTLLALGVKNIYLGPTLPAFISPGVLDILVKEFGIRPIATSDQDLKAILG